MIDARVLPRLLLALAVLLPTPLLAQLRFQEGRHYQVIAQPQTTGTVAADRIEVAEVFSYLCGACFQAHAMVDQLAAGLPADAAMAYVHAGFGRRDWQVMQQAHVTAQALGIAARNHARLFAAIWETAEFPYFDPATRQPRNTPPVIRDAARFYARGGGVTEDAFAQKAASPEVQATIQRNEALMKAWQVPATPSFVVAGRYRINNDAVTSLGDLQAMVNYLIGLERTRLQRAGAARQ